MFSQDYSQEIFLSSQKLHESDEATFPTEESSELNCNSSRTIDIIFEENHQLGGMVTASLESLDKYREKLKEELIKTNLQLKEKQQIHDEQKRSLVNLQMQIENLDCQYQQEVQQRQELLDKTNVTYEVVALLSQEHNTISNTSDNLQEDYKRINDAITGRLSYLKELHFKLIKDESESQTRRDELMRKISSIKDECMKYKEEMTQKLDKKRTESVDLSEKKVKLEKLLNAQLQERNQLSEDYRNISINYEMEKKKILELQQKLKDVQKKESKEIPKLKLMISSARNELANVTKTYEVNEKHAIEMKMKMKQALTKGEQLESSIVESRQKEVENQEQVTSLTVKNNSLETKEEELQSELKHIQNVQFEITRLKQILEEEVSIKEKLTHTTDINRKDKIEVNNKLMTVKKEVEDTVVLKNKLQSDNCKLKNKKKLLAHEQEENKKAIYVKRRAIEETVNCKKEKVLQLRSEFNNLKEKFKIIECDYAKLLEAKENLDRIYKANNTDLTALKLKNITRQTTFEGNHQIYNAAIEDEEDKVNDLENSLLENLDKLEDLTYLNDRKMEIEGKMKKNDDIWITEKDTETHKFNLNLQDLVRERAIFEANTDAISQQEVENLNKMRKLISTNNEQSMKLELKLQSCIAETESVKKKELEYMSKISRLEDKLNHVSEAAMVTRKEIKAAFAPNTEEKEYRPSSTSTKSKMQDPTAKQGILKEVKSKSPYDFESN